VSTDQLVIWDTGLLAAAADRDDKHHSAAVALMREMRTPLHVPAPVMVEVCYWIEQKVGPGADAAFLRSVRSGHVILDHPTDEDLDRMIELVETYRNFPLGTVDASVIAIAERLGATQIATIDQDHFRAVKPAHCSAFELLPAGLVVEKRPRKSKRNHGAKR
jgi:predicted nucleic acid-binding protein